VLEGPATLLAPASSWRGTPAWIQVLLLIALLAGVGVFGWQLWVRSNPESGASLAADSEAESKKGPITGSVNGLEAIESDEAERVKAKGAADPEHAVEPVTDPVAEEPVVEEPEPVEAGAEPGPKPIEAKPAAKESEALRIPTHNLPRDPAKASDVLVHRSLPLIRSGQLRLAEATLDRAWELDPKNPQAMAGYARLFVAKKDGERAVKWAKRALRKRSRRVEYHILYGDALQLEGETDAARKAWRKALSIDPASRAARARLAN